jgi:hypothetical protein
MHGSSGNEDAAAPRSARTSGDPPGEDGGPAVSNVSASPAWLPGNKNVPEATLLRHDAVLFPREAAVDDLLAALGEIYLLRLVLPM